jgi:hypothetical protein
MFIKASWQSAAYCGLSTCGITSNSLGIESKRVIPEPPLDRIENPGLDREAGRDFIIRSM